MIRSVLLTNIYQDSVTTFIRKIHINIRHRHARRIQKPLKKKTILEWINIRNTGKIGKYCSCCRSSSWSDWNTIIFPISDEIRDDTEISIESHKINDHELIFEPIKY